MRSTRPDARELFGLYHLGLDREGRYRFRNLSECGRVLDVDPGQLMDWLREVQMDPDSVGQVDFNMAKWHAEAQFVSPAEADALLDRAHAGYVEALQRRAPGRFFHQVDYDDIWGDRASSGPEPNGGLEPDGGPEPGDKGSGGRR